MNRIRILALAAVSGLGLLTLSACEERPYATTPPPAETKAPPPPAAKLAGEPAAAPAPVYAAPAAPAEPAPPPAARYDSGAVVAMAPIPNPGGGYGGANTRRHAHYNTAPEGSASYAPVKPHPVYAPKAPPAKPPVYAAPKPPEPKKPAYVAAPPKAPTYAAKAPEPKPVAPKKPEPKPVAYAKAEAPKAPAPKPAAPKPGTAAPETKAMATAAAGAAMAGMHHDAPAKAEAPKAPAVAPVAAGDRSAKLAALQSALTDAIAKTAKLNTPERFTAGQTADVSLVVPADFADTLKAEAARNGMPDAATSANMTAVLSGDGFSVSPEDTQTRPVTGGQAVEYHWAVVAQPNAAGPLHADVGVVLNGGADTLALGSVHRTAGLGLKAPKMIGIGLLVLIALVAIFWLTRGSGPRRSDAARKASREARGGQPLDMGGGDEAGAASHH